MSTSTDTYDGITELTVANIFTDGASKYVIPIYQRDYAWDKDEIDQLLVDILTFKEDNYYLGNLIVSKKGDRYDVIDGQQRLTTLYILCKCLDIPVLEKSLTFQIRDVSNNTLEKLLELSKTIGTPDEEIYSEEIFRGYNIIIKQKDVLEKIKSRLDHVILLRINIPSDTDTDLNHYFEIMNTRGEQLEAQDIIKARMMRKLDPKDKRVFSMIWNFCSDMDCYIQMKFDTETRKRIFGETWNDFIHIHNGYKDSYYEDLANIINNTDESDITTLEDILEDKSEHRREETKNKSSDESIDSGFESIINFPYFLIHINILLNDPKNVPLDDKNLLDMYDLEYSPEYVKFFIFHLLKYKFLFDKFIIKSDKGGDWSLQKMDNLSYYKGTFDDDLINRRIRTLQSALRITYTSPIRMDWITLLLRTGSLLSDNRGESFLNVTEDYCKKKVRKALYEDKKTEYAYRDMERIVYTYLDYILWREGYDGIIKPNSEWNFSSTNSLEHFYPQNPIGVHEELPHNLLHSFGNLCLVSVSTNAHFSNMPPLDKINIYPDKIKQSLKLMIMADIAKTIGWDANSKTIEEHGQEMLTLLRDDISKAP